MIDRDDLIKALDHCIRNICSGCPYQQTLKLLFGVNSCDDMINSNTVIIPIKLLSSIQTMLKADQTELLRQHDYIESLEVLIDQLQWR